MNLKGLMNELKCLNDFYDLKFVFVSLNVENCRICMNETK